MTAILTDMYGSIIAVNNTRSAAAIAKMLSILAFTTFLMNFVRDVSIPLSHYNAEGRKRLHYSVPLNISARIFMLIGGSGFIQKSLVFHFCLLFVVDFNVKFTVRCTIQN